LRLTSQGFFIPVAAGSPRVCIRFKVLGMRPVTRELKSNLHGVSPT